MASIDEQLETTARVWTLLEAMGISEDTPLALDLHWHATKSGNAQDLAAKLVEQHNLSADAQRRGDEWVVLAQVGPKKFKLADVEKLVREMHALGKAHDCVFDGWHPAEQHGDVPDRPW